MKQQLLPSHRSNAISVGSSVCARVSPGRLALDEREDLVVPCNQVLQIADAKRQHVAQFALASQVERPPLPRIVSFDPYIVRSDLR